MHVYAKRSRSKNFAQSMGDLLDWSFVLPEALVDLTPFLLKPYLKSLMRSGGAKHPLTILPNQCFHPD